MRDALHPIQVVVDRTGLSAHVIRIWEKRYGAVTPERTDTNRRLYSEDQIERLSLLRRLADTGHGIGYVAKLPTEKLRTLVDPSPGHSEAIAEAANAAAVSALLARAMDAVQRLDARALGDALKAAEVKLGAQGVLQRLVAPLAGAFALARARPQRCGAGLATAPPSDAAAPR